MKSKNTIIRVAENFFYSQHLLDLSDGIEFKKMSIFEHIVITSDEVLHRKWLSDDNPPEEV